MLEAIRRIAEQKISEAVREGRLSVAGWRNRPLPSDNNSLVPEDLRLAYKVLKTRGIFRRRLKRGRKSSRSRTCLPPAGTSTPG